MIVLLASGRCVPRNISRDDWSRVCSSSSLVCWMGFRPGSASCFLLLLRWRIRWFGPMHVWVLRLLSRCRVSALFLLAVRAVLTLFLLGDFPFVMFSGLRSFLVGGIPRFGVFFEC